MSCNAKKQEPRARRARARAREDQDRFLNCWYELRNLKLALLSSGVKWNQIQAWRRWDADFLRAFEMTREVVETIRVEEFQERIIRRAFAGSPRAINTMIRMFWHDRLCPLCQRPKNIQEGNCGKKEEPPPQSP